MTVGDFVTANQRLPYWWEHMLYDITPDMDANQSPVVMTPTLAHGEGAALSDSARTEWEENFYAANGYYPGWFESAVYGLNDYLEDRLLGVDPATPGSFVGYFEDGGAENDVGLLQDSGELATYALMAVGLYAIWKAL